MQLPKGSRWPSGNRYRSPLGVERRIPLQQVDYPHYARFRLPSDGHDVDDLIQACKVVGVASVEGQVGRKSGRSDHQIDCSCPAGFPLGAEDRGEDSSVGPGGIDIEWQRIERGFCPLETILPPASLHSVVCGMRASCQLSQSHGADSDLVREGRCLDVFKIDNHRSVQQPARWSGRLRHEEMDLGRQKCRGRPEDPNSQHWGQSGRAPQQLQRK